MNKRLKDYLHYNWYFYLIHAIVMVVLWLIIFSLLARPKANEELNIFIDAHFVNSDQLEAELYIGFDETKIRSLNVDFSSHKSEYFGVIFSTRGVVSTDLIIIGDEVISEGNYLNSFLPITEEVLNKYLPGNEEYEYLEEDGIIYGILVYDSSWEINPFQDLINFSYSDERERFYLCLNPKSVNLGVLNKKNKSDDGALIGLKNFLSYLSDKSKK